MRQIERHLQSAETLAAAGNATGAVEALLFAHSVGSAMIPARENVIRQMKEVFAESRVPGYLTREERYFNWESAIGMEEWCQKISAITMEYARKHSMDIESIQSVLDSREYMGENTGE
jgi:hypothetical protein